MQMNKLFTSMMAAIAVGALLILGGCGEKGSEFATVGTGGVTGVYYPTGGAIANMVNANKNYGVQLAVQSTGGSVFNVNALMSGDIQFGIVQSDRGFQAWSGLAEWQERGKQTKLRSVFSIHPELVNLIMAADAGVNTCADLKGKSISVGNPGSGTRKNAKDALSTCGLTFDDIDAHDLKAAEGAKMLQDGRIDGYFYTVGHPNGSIKEAYAGRRAVEFVTFDNVDGLLQKHPYYVKEDVPVELYNANGKKASTFGVKATLLTSSDVDENTVYAVTKEVFENLDAFKELHPAFAGLSKESMLKGLSAPMHKGAKKYYKEAGLL